MQLLVEHELALGDVAGQVGNRVGDVAGRHRQDGKLRQRARASADATRPLVERCEVAVEVAGIPSAARHLASSRGHLAHRLAVARDVGDDDENVAAEIEGEVLGDRQGDPRRRDALDERVLDSVHEEDDVADRGALLEDVADIGGVRVGDADRGEDDGEGLVLRDARLRRHLSRELEVRQSADGEDRQLLATDERGKAVDRGDPGQDRHRAASRGTRG